MCIIFTFKKLNENKNFLISLPYIQYNYKKKFNLTKILNYRIRQEEFNIYENKKKFSAINDFFLYIKPLLVVSNNSRSIDGQYLDCAKKKNIPIMCIPHGTISSYFNRYDRIYKKTIAESITYPGSDFISQSKISSLFFQKEKKNYKRLIQCGNLLFDENKIFSKNYKKRILYAVTMKNFQSIQYLGVEMYYEYLDNLAFLNKLAENNKLEILVKNHPSISKLTQSLQIRYKNLIFTDEKIQNALSKTCLTISFSSTVIEDSLHILNPVILFDRWKRYQHCKAQNNPISKNQAIYYINDDRKLIKCINIIFNSKNIKFNNYILEGKSKQNIQKIFKSYY